MAKAPKRKTKPSSRPRKAKGAGKAPANRKSAAKDPGWDIAFEVTARCCSPSAPGCSGLPEQLSALMVKPRSPSLASSVRRAPLSASSSSNLRCGGRAGRRQQKDLTRGLHSCAYSRRGERNADGQGVRHRGRCRRTRGRITLGGVANVYARRIRLRPGPRPGERGRRTGRLPRQPPRPKPHPGEIEPRRHRRREFGRAVQRGAALRARARPCPPPAGNACCSTRATPRAASAH